MNVETVTDTYARAIEATSSFASEDRGEVALVALEARDAARALGEAAEELEASALAL